MLLESVRLEQLYVSFERNCEWWLDTTARRATCLLTPMPFEGTTFARLQAKAINCVQNEWQCGFPHVTLYLFAPQSVC